MANLFYGFSASNEDSDVKNVYVPVDEADGMVEGDSITVYFSNGNTINAPSLNILYQNGSLTSDEGLEIKSINQEADIDYMWQSGEVVLFTLTSQRFNAEVNSAEDGATTDSVSSANQAMYYYLNRGIRANSDYYGLTRLFGRDSDFPGDSYQEVTVGESENPQELGLYELENGSYVLTTDETPVENKTYFEHISGDFEDWINSPITEEDENQAATTYLIKKIYGPTAVSYQSAVEGDLTTLGTLTVGDTAYSIDTPNNLITNTSALINDGDIVDNISHNRLESSTHYADGYFITNVLDEDLVLYEGDSEKVGITRAIQTNGEQFDDTSKIYGNFNKLNIISDTYSSNNDNHLIVLGNQKTETKPSSVINLYGDGGIKLYADESNYSTPTLDIASSGITSLANMAAPSFTEGGVLLEDKYTGELIRERYVSCKCILDGGVGKRISSIDNSPWDITTGNTTRTVTPSGTSTHANNSAHVYQTVTLNTSNNLHYKPIALVGYNINFAKTGVENDSMKVNLWEFFISNDSVPNQCIVGYSFSNLTTGVREVYMTFDILWKRVF